MKIKKHLIILAAILISSAAYSWDGAKTGKIQSIEVTNGGNLGFRVHLVGAPAMCGGEVAWAYLNENESNYNTYVSALLAAYMADKTVVIYSTKTPFNGNDFCRIGHIQIRD